MTKISLVRCDESADAYSQIVEHDLDVEALEARLVDTIPQTLDAGIARELHNAAHHEEHGPVTYLQHVQAGGFSVYVGKPDALEEHFFGPGQWVAFMDDRGPGHASKVGSEGVQRVLRVLKGHLE